jgi:protein-S-isoprenylcysteine O-methyltransferase Ste14
MKILRLITGYVLALTLFTVLIPWGAIAAGRWLDGLIGWAPLAYWPLHALLAVPIFLFGVFWMAWSWYSLLSIGRGHPVEAFQVEITPTTQHLIVVGPFRYTRNPMSLGYIAVILGLGVALGSLTGALIVPCVITALMIIHFRGFEEKGLERRFGAEYEAYREQVPMLIPRFPRRK